MPFAFLHKKGFTVIELLIVVAITVLLAGFLLGTFSEYARYQSYQQSVSEIALAISQTQADARVARFDQDHGLSFTSDSLTRYHGSTFNPIDPNNTTKVFSNVTLIPVLANGVSELHLQKVVGIPSATGTILIVGTQYDATTTFSISPSGVIQY